MKTEVGLHPSLKPVLITGKHIQDKFKKKEKSIFMSLQTA